MKRLILPFIILMLFVSTSWAEYQGWDNRNGTGSASITCANTGVPYASSTNVISCDATNYHYDSSGKILYVGAVVTAPSSSPQTLYAPKTAGDTNFVCGIAGNDDGLSNDHYVCSEGTVLGSTNRLDIAPGGAATLSSSLGLGGPFNYVIDSQASDTYVVSMSPTWTAYTAGDCLTFKANTANTGAATLNVDSLGATAIKKNKSGALADNDILSGQLVNVCYDGTNFQMQSQLANASGSQTYPAAGIMVSNGSAFGTSLTAPSGTIVGTSDTQTLTNKRITKRDTTTTQSATPVINTDNTDHAHITALAQAITSMTSSLSGTPVAGDTLWIDITDNGTARAITWGASFEASGNVALPTTTVLSVRLDVGFVWNEVTSKWRCIAVS